MERFNIQLEGLTVGYKKNNGKVNRIIEDVNFNAAQGEIVALIGKNGIGKSTLLKSIAGFLPWFDGEVKVGDKILKNLNNKQIAKIISFVSTSNLKIPNLTVFDLVAYGRFPYTNWIGMLTQKDENIVMDAIEKVGLNGFQNRMVLNISDGERQRAMIARALAQDTPVVILDEPTAYLDVSNKYEIFHLLKILAAEKRKTVVLSTHDLNIAIREVDKLWIIAKNEKFQGAPEDAVLNGCLNRLFPNKNIEFDDREGQFFLKKKFKKKVRVLGNGLKLNWTLRALNRKGYQIVTEAKHDFVVTTDSLGWKISDGQNDRDFQTLYDLLAFLD